MASLYSRGIATLQAISRVLRVQRMPLFIAALASVGLAVPEQTGEIYRAIAQDNVLNVSEAGPRIELGLAIFGLVAMGAALCSVAYALAARLGHTVTDAALTALRFVPPVLLLALFLSAAIGVYNARTPDPSVEVRSASLAALRSIYLEHVVEEDDLEGIRERLFGYNRLLLYASLAIFLAGLLFAAVCPRGSSNATVSTPSQPTLLFRPWLSYIVFAGVAAVIAVFTAYPVDIPQTVGPLAIFAAFIVCLVLILGQLSLWSDRSGIPWTSIFIGAGLVIGFLDINDNHHAYRAIPASNGAAAPTTTQFDERFKAWFEARPDRDSYGHDRPYPVYVVAAQGGGIYAAFHTASLLSGIQDQCPTFASHLFAISSVSGGSLGAAVFTGLVKERAGHFASPQPPRPCSEKPIPYSGSVVEFAETVLYQDLFSPLAAGLLFSDLLQFFIPIPILKLDRALRFELGFESAMDKRYTRTEAPPPEIGKDGENFLASSFADHWHPEARWPALVVNATEVGSGRRRVISPFAFAEDRVEFLPTNEPFPTLGRPKGLRISTAAGLSARFPWIAPAGFYYEAIDKASASASEGTQATSRQVKKIRLVDGAYFDNSGVATAVDLIQSMQEAAVRNGFADRIRINLIVLTSGSYPQQEFYGLGEAMSPIGALLSTRTARSYITIAAAERELNGGREKDAAASKWPRLRKITLKDMDYPPPLGWRLSSITMLLIEAQNGIGSECDLSGSNPKTKSGRFDGDCLLQSLSVELAPR